MIKDFNTYIKEGRMGRLINSGEDSIRKQDLHDLIRTDLLEIMQRHVNKEKTEDETKEDLREFMKKHDILPHVDELEEMASGDGYIPVDCSQNEYYFSSGRFHAKHVYFEYSCRIVVKHSTENLKTYYKVIAFVLDKDDLYVQLHSRPHMKWSCRLRDLFKEQEEVGSRVITFHLN